MGLYREGMRDERAEGGVCVGRGGRADIAAFGIEQHRDASGDSSDDCLERFDALAAEDFEEGAVRLECGGKGSRRFYQAQAEIAHTSHSWLWQVADVRIEPH